jgi:DNA-binding XRE family transcriptional regulator
MEYITYFCEMDNKNIFQEIVKKAVKKRKNLKITQAKLALLSDMPLDTIRYIEGGKNTTINSLGKYLGSLEVVIGIIKC